jgi:hypothetical protein
MPTTIGAARRPHPRLWSVALALALVTTLVSGCTKGSTARTSPGVAHVAPAGAAAPIDAVAWSLAGRLATPTYTGDTTAAMIAALARSGIGTYADPSAAKPERAVTSPASAMRLLEFQVHALAVGVWAGAGFTGAEIDTVLPLPPSLDGMPTTSQLLAGYVAAAATPGGALARALMSGQNLLAPSALRFPAVVLTLFAADLAAPKAGSTSGAVFTHGSITHAVDERLAGGICSDGKNWINRTIGGFFSALRLATPANLPGAIVVTIWNWLVSAGQAFVQNLITTVTDAVLSTIRSIAAGVSTVALQIAALVPYSVKVLASGADGGGGTFRLGSKPLAGTFTASVTAGDLPAWPDVLADCAKAADIALPDFQSKDIPLTWGPLEAPGDGLLGPTEAAHDTDVTDANGQATWAFRIGADPGDPAGEQTSDVDAMPVAAHRPEIDKARKRLTDALLGYIPALLRPFVARLFQPYIDGLQGRLNTLLDARGRGTAFLIYHAGVKPHPSASPGCKSGPVRPGTYTGTNTNAFTETIPMTGGALVDHNNATGPVTMTVAANGSVTGSWSYHSRETTDESMVVSGISAKYHIDRTWGMTAGTIGGTICHLTLTASAVQMLSCTGTCGDDPPAATPAGSRDFGAPLTATAAHLTWQWKGNAADGTYTDTFTIAVAGSG